MRRRLLPLIALALCCPLLGAQFRMAAWEGALSLSGATVLARNGDDPAWPGALPADGWTPLPLQSDFKSSHPDWGPVVWYRFSVTLPDSSPGEPLTLRLGKIADFDSCWFNGSPVGENALYRGRAPDELYDLVREYEIPLSLLRAGRENVVDIRVDNRGHGAGGVFAGEPALWRGYAGQGKVDPSELRYLILVVFYFVTGCFFVYLSLRIRRNPANLPFGLFCVALSVYFLSLLQARSAFFSDYGIWMRLRITCLWTALPLFLTFMLLFLRHRFRPHHLAYLGLAAASLPLAWILPSVNRLFWITERIVWPSWIYPVAVILILVIRIASGSKEARALLSLLILLTLLLGFDMLRSQALEGPLSRLPYLSHWGLFAFILGFAVILINRQVRLQEEMERLFEMATKDSLTGAASRAHLENFLNLELAKASRYRHPLSVVMADLDRFKEVNDSFGHPAGDAVLRSFGAILRRSIRECDMAGRYGGEEFILVLPETDLSGALLVAERVRRELERQGAAFAGHAIPVTASLGAAEFAPGQGAADLVRAADDALYQAKAEGRNRVCAARRPLVGASQPAGLRG